MKKIKVSSDDNLTYFILEGQEPSTRYCCSNDEWIMYEIEEFFLAKGIGKPLIRRYKEAVQALHDLWR